MSGRVESGVLDEGDSAGVPQEGFENHFRDMSWNILPSLVVVEERPPYDCKALWVYNNTQ